LSPSVPLSLRPSVSPFLCVTLFASPLCAFAPSRLCVESFCLSSSRSRCLRAASSKEDGGSISAFSAPRSRVPAMQMPKLAGGGTLPASRRLVPIQRQPPVWPPSNIGRAAPASRVAAGVNGGKLAKFAIGNQKRAFCSNTLSFLPSRGR
jgi:hypothetical protein